jgi:hypothetical protein
MDRRKFSLLSVSGFFGSLFARGAKAEMETDPPPQPQLTAAEEVKADTDWTGLTCKNDACKSAFKINKKQTGYPVCPRCGSGWIGDLVFVRSSPGGSLPVLSKDEIADGGARGRGVKVTYDYGPPVPLKATRTYDYNFHEADKIKVAQLADAVEALRKLRGV